MDLQTSIRQIKADREMGNRYMLFEELLKNEFKEGKAEGLSQGRIEGKIEVFQSSIILVLNLKQQTIPEDTTNKIHSIKDLKSLEELLSFAANAASLEDFVNLLDEKITKNAP